MIASDADLVRFHEGCTLTAIRDMDGWSIGYGHDGAQEGQSCTQAQAEALFALDLEMARQRAATALGNVWEVLDDVRRAVLVDMAFELGGAGLAGFHQMLESIRGYRYTIAAEQGMQSLWARQVPKRAQMDMEMLASGEWPVV